MPELKDPLEEQVAQLTAIDQVGPDIAARLSINLRRVYRIRSRPNVLARVTEITQGVLTDLGVDPESVISGIADIAFDTATSVQNKLKAYELLGKHLGLFVERVEDVTDRGHDEWIKLVSVQAQVDVHDLDFLK